MIGERIGHLRVIASIGVGGMGAVWHAVDELLDRHVALKVIRPELMSRPGLAERFRSEAIVLARLQHPCIAALYGLEKRGEEFVMVMEFVDGETLDARLAQQGVLPWPEATRITRAVLDALDHAHESGVIHRDIKPANVMITRAGRVKVMDFGIARLVGAQRQTRTGAAVGTPSYMSPEQLLGQEVDGRADVYAVGTLLYELTTGHLPFEVEGDYLRMIAQLQQVPGAPSTHDASLPSGLDRVVARALEKDPADRFATSGEFRDALEELEREHGVLRPYGTPAAGSSAVTGASLGRGTPSGIPSNVGQQPTPVFNANQSAVLTPVDNASGVTPVPFALNPAGATPIDLDVPVAPFASAAQPLPERPLPPLSSTLAFGVATPTPEYVSVVPVSDVAAVTDAPPIKRSATPRALLAGGAIALVAAAGVLLSRNVTARENQAAAPPPIVVQQPAASAPIPVTPTPAPATPAPSASAVPDTVSKPRTDALDSAALKKAAADSARIARRSARDSVRRLADSIKAAAAAPSPFALPGGASTAELNAAKDAARRAADDCVSALNARDMSRLESLFGGNKKDVLRIAKDGKLEVGIPLNRQVDTEASDRATASFRAVLHWKNGNNEDRQVSASFRAIAARTGTAWITRRCLIDDDGGARF
jgi:eukaryotic-like serine/threonine-protein kinase